MSKSVDKAFKLYQDFVLVPKRREFEKKNKGVSGFTPIGVKFFDAHVSHRTDHGMKMLMLTLVEIYDKLYDKR